MAILDELLKDDPETLAKVNSAIDKANVGRDENHKIKLGNIGSGDYVGVKKYNDLQTKMDELKGTLEAESEAKLKEVTDNYEKKISDMNNSFIQNRKIDAVERAIAGLGSLDKWQAKGVRDSIDLDKITLDEQYNVTGGLEEQFESIKGDFVKSEPAEKEKVVGTSNNQVISNGVSPKRVFSPQEISNMSMSEYEAHRAEILGQ